MLLTDVVQCFSKQYPFVYRAGRLTDGPYTSYDLNTLLKATAGQRRAVVIGQGMLNQVSIGENSKTFMSLVVKGISTEITENKKF